MGLQSGWAVWKDFDEYFKPVPGKPDVLASFGEYEQFRYGLGVKIVEWNQASGRNSRDLDADDSPFRFCMISRKKPSEHRWGSLRGVPIAERLTPPIRLSKNYADQNCEYAGWMGFIDAIADGDWRLATNEEREECAKRDETARLAALETAKEKKLQNSGAMEILSALAGLIKVTPEQLAAAVTGKAVTNG